jgi:alcohol dehydrogenase (cytochrome c)
VNRGLAVLGSTLFWETLDGYLLALDANTGNVLWQTQVASPSDGYTLTGAPLVVNRLVVAGVAGGEFGIRGFLAAYDADTGKQVWKFLTIPGPGEPGHETWENDAWRTGGGPTWNTGSYDPSLDLLYWGVGNPAPDFSGNVRPGDNLFTNSVIALHASTGKLAWYFQFTPHDEHDWDSAQTPILAELSINGTKRQVICWANRNGFYYVLDRVTGEFLTGVPFIEQNWAEGLDSAGRPRLVSSQSISNTGQLIKPGVLGGTNWQNAAYDEKKGLKRLVFSRNLQTRSVGTGDSIKAAPARSSRRSRSFARLTPRPERGDGNTFRLGSRGNQASTAAYSPRKADWFLERRQGTCLRWIRRRDMNCGASFSAAAHLRLRSRSPWVGDRS